MGRELRIGSCSAYGVRLSTFSKIKLVGYHRVLIGKATSRLSIVSIYNTSEYEYE